MAKGITQHRTTYVLPYINTKRLCCFKDYRSTSNLEAQDNNVKELFVHYDAEIHRWLKLEDRGYEGSKFDPKDWADLFEEDPNFAEEFNIIFNNCTIPEADQNNEFYNDAAIP